MYTVLKYENEFFSSPGLGYSQLKTVSKTEYYDTVSDSNTPTPPEEMTSKTLIPTTDSLPTFHVLVHEDFMY